MRSATQHPLAVGERLNGNQVDSERNVSPLIMNGRPSNRKQTANLPSQDYANYRTHLHTGVPVTVPSCEPCRISLVTADTVAEVLALPHPVPSLGRAVEQFLAAKPLSANGRRSYAHTLGTVAGDLGADLTLDEFTAERLRHVLEDRWGDASAATWNNRLTAFGSRWKRQTSGPSCRWFGRCGCPGSSRTSAGRAMSGTGVTHDQGSVLVVDVFLLVDLQQSFSALPGSTTRSGPNRATAIEAITVIQR